MPSQVDNWDEETDLLVFGSGAGGFAASLFGAKLGLKVLLCEKNPHLGGTTATSGGGIWVPGTKEGLDHGDTIEHARFYLKNELGNYYRADLIDAYLEHGAKVIDLLDKETEVKFDLLPWPDYHSDAPGGAKIGRSLMARPFDGKKLGADFALVRRPMHRLMVLGGLMIGNNEVQDFLNPVSSFATFRRVTGKLARYFSDRLRYSRGTDLRFGNALICRMLFSLRKTSTATIWTKAALQELIRDGNRVCGAIVNREGRTVRVKARRGVVLATGGFPNNPDMLKTYGGSFPHRHSLGEKANVGDGINAAIRVGGVVDTELSNVANWTPASVITENGEETPIIYGYLDRGRPGVIAVNSEGRRFVNESNSYNDIVNAMFKDGYGQNGRKFYFVCDRAFVTKHGLGLLRPWPWTRSLAPYVKSKYITVADSLKELATRIGVNPENLEQTVQRHNGYAATGVDLEFGKGSTAYNRMFGDKSVKPNPNLAPIETPPFIALPIHPATIGTTIGLKTNANAQVLDGAGQPIPGLYACGNDLAAIMRGFYPGGGTMIGPGMVFGYLAAQHANGS